MKKYHHCVKFTYPLSFQTGIPKVDQHTGGKWLIHGTKHRKDNQLQSNSNNNVDANANDNDSDKVIMIMIMTMTITITIKMIIMIITI